MIEQQDREAAARLWADVDTDNRMVDSPPPSENARQWLTGLIVIVAVVVSYIGFARVSVGWTLIIATTIFVGLIIFLWRVGRKKRTGRGGR